MDDALTLVHLFASLPAEGKYGIPPAAVEKCRRLALEWQAFVARTGALRKTFISVKGFYYQVRFLVVVEAAGGFQLPWWSLHTRAHAWSNPPHNPTQPTGANPHPAPSPLCRPRSRASW
jgi:hypothetical protein